MTIIPKRKFALEEKDLAIEADENNKVAEEKENRFLNKLQKDATDNIEWLSEGTDIKIGTNDAGNQVFNGVISNFRVLKGTALYTSDFEVPIYELTNITNTKLLCCQDTEDATAAQTATSGLSAGGNVSASPCNPFNDDILIIK